ncbi:hypothetical protein DMI62_14165 [Escherichia coli]|nr:hypothetical protein [Escherichia coli]
MEYADRLEHAVNIFFRCVAFGSSPQSLTYVSDWGFTRLSPSCNSNYLEYIHLLSFCALSGAQISGAFDDQVI